MPPRPIWTCLLQNPDLSPIFVGIPNHMDIYINGLSAISPQPTTNSGSFLEDTIGVDTPYIKCQEPVYKEYIEPLQIRRMSRIIKMGVVGALMALKNASIEKPGAVITGTALGCLEDTEKFLRAIINDNEQFLTPTSFIQSTHNTISGQIALLLQCNEYNSTYVHRGFSFESSLQDAMLLLAEGNRNVLVGAIDEFNQYMYDIKEKLGFWRKDGHPSLELLQKNGKGTIAGEGSSFFVLDSQPTNGSYAKVLGLKTVYNPSDFREIQNAYVQLLNENNLVSSQVEVMLLGKNGDEEMDGFMDLAMGDKNFPEAVAGFKHLSGEYHTAIGFAFWLAAKALQKQSFPKVTQLKGSFPSTFSNVLIYNQHEKVNHSLTLLAKC